MQSLISDVGLDAWLGLGSELDFYLLGNLEAYDDEKPYVEDHDGCGDRLCVLWSDLVGGW